LNKVDKEGISCDDLSSILEPFIFACARCQNSILVNRIKEKVILPLLECNITPDAPEEVEEKEEDPEKWVDGGKLSLKT